MQIFESNTDEECTHQLTQWGFRREVLFAIKQLEVDPKRKYQLKVYAGKMAIFIPEKQYEDLCKNLQCAY